MIKTIIFLTCFLFLSCKSSKGIEYFQDDQIEINLMDRVNPKKIQSDYELYGLKMVCVLDAKENIVVYHYDASFSTRDVMIELLSKEVGIESVMKTKGCVY